MMVSWFPEDSGPHAPRYMLVDPPSFDDPLCAQFGPDLFFRSEEDIGLEHEAVARRICAVCPHVVECALHGLEHEDFGIWGGFAVRDRAVIEGGQVGNGSGVHVRSRNPERAYSKMRERLRRAGFDDETVDEIEQKWSERYAEISDDREGEAA